MSKDKKPEPKVEQGSAKIEIPDEFRAPEPGEGKGPQPRHKAFMGVSGSRLVQWMAQDPGWRLSRVKITEVMRKLEMPHKRSTISLRYNMGRSPAHKRIDIPKAVQEALHKVLVS